MYWWRVEFDGKGAVVSCERVEAQGSDGPLVAYVQGETKLQARMACAAWYKQYRAKQNAWMKRKVARLKAQGLCCHQYGGCLKAPDPGYVSCRSCRVKKMAMNAKLEAVGRTRNRPSPEEARAGYMRAHGRMTLHAPTVLKLFDSLGPTGFRRWLVDYIQSGRQQAEQRVMTDPVLTRAVGNERRASQRAQQ